MKDVFKIAGIKRTYDTIPEFLKAGARQYGIVIWKGLLIL